MKSMYETYLTKKDFSSESQSLVSRQDDAQGTHAKHATFFPSLISLCCLVLHVLLWCCWRLVAKFQLEGRVVQRSGNRNWLVVSSETIRMYPTSTWLKRTTKQQGIASRDSYSDFSDGKMDSWREHQPALSSFVNKERMRGVNFKRTTWEPIRLWRITQEFLKNWSERIYICKKTCSGLVASLWYRTLTEMPEIFVNPSIFKTLTLAWFSRAWRAFEGLI
jgi:hypothetical protein